MKTLLALLALLTAEATTAHAGERTFKVFASTEYKGRVILTPTVRYVPSGSALSAVIVPNFLVEDALHLLDGRNPRPGALVLENLTDGEVWFNIVESGRHFPLQIVPAHGKVTFVPPPLQ